MTGTTLKRNLRMIYIALTAVLLLSLVAKMGKHIPAIASTNITIILNDIYDYLKDMSLVFITVVATYLAYVFQKRSSFTQRLDREWRGIVKTKSVLYRFCETANPGADDYLHAFCTISETLDNMRSVYQNVGETSKLVGLYPFEPLHDMRRVLMSLDPRKYRDVQPAQRKVARDAILQSFYALRETFLEELDLEQPAHPLLVSGGQRIKDNGATRRAYRGQQRQLATQNHTNSRRGDVDAYLAQLKTQEINKRRSSAGNSHQATASNAKRPTGTIIPPTP